MHTKSCWLLHLTGESLTRGVINPTMIVPEILCGHWSHPAIPIPSPRVCRESCTCSSFPGISHWPGALAVSSFFLYSWHSNRIFQLSQGGIRSDLSNLQAKLSLN